MNIKKLLAASVHVYTSVGVVLAFIAALAILRGDLATVLVCLWLAVFVDSTDGTLARRFDVANVLPGFNGRRLDDIIDYITYAFLPALALIRFEVLPPAWQWVAVLPLLASAYGFSQELAKTEESFVGFPSYWNVVFLYLYFLNLPDWAVIGILIGLSGLVFVPLRYIYPSHTRWMQTFTIVISCIYGAIVSAVCLFPTAPWAGTVAAISLFYPAYYLGASLWHHRQAMRREQAEMLITHH